MRRGARRPSSGPVGRPALVLALLGCAGALSAAAWAAPLSRTASAIVGTGSIVCKQVTGSITYSPADRLGGTTAEVQVFSFRASRCSTTHSNVSHVLGGSVTTTVRRATNSCADLLVSQPSRGSGAWEPSSIHPTTASFSGYTIVTSATGDVGFTVPNTGGRASVSGSFAGKDHGARSTATVYTNMTTAQVETACISLQGLSRQTIISGTATFS